MLAGTLIGIAQETTERCGKSDAVTSYHFNIKVTIYCPYVNKDNPLICTYFFPIVLYIFSKIYSLVHPMLKCLVLQHVKLTTKVMYDVRVQILREFPVG